MSVVISPKGDHAPPALAATTTLMQASKVGFFEFYSLIIPSLVNWLIPAACMHFAIPKATPEADSSIVVVQRGGFAVAGLFGVTIALAVTSYNLLKLPPFIGMTTGLALLKLFGYYLRKTHVATPIPIEPPLGARLKRPAAALALGAPMEEAIDFEPTLTMPIPRMPAHARGPGRHSRLHRVPV